VVTGQPLLVIEAMKMEHTIAAPTDGVVSALAVREGQQVTVDQPLATVSPVQSSDTAPEAAGEKS
ncbi:MAG: acetyl-CoA/propionyl-CoA carboxylase, biotin carboxylase, biotin carboxyl carrier protein, partial [Pseudonocardiales bacterium]|nr:acetyl-CoA/propionyl-CoA carboxylase, biotin carboxylase, biotin carboxyl carrier protein [Pseudonocardiales bacterium]